MKGTLSTPSLTLQRRIVRPKFSEQLAWDDNLAREVAAPLFDAGVVITAITERHNYCTGMMGTRRYHDLRLLLQGAMRLNSTGTTHELKPGDLMVCPVGVPFEVLSGTEATWWLYFLIADLPEWAPFKRHGLYVRPCEHALLMYHLLRDILDAMVSHQPLAMAQARNEARALADLLHHELRAGAQWHSPKRVALQNLVAELTASNGNRWTVEQMASRMDMSPQHLTRLFRQELGIAPGTLLVRQRLKQAARELINTDLKIDAIATRAGYASLHSFTRLFTRHIGLPPGQYRKRHAPEPVQEA